MDYNVKSVGKKKIAGFHLVGPWEQTVKQGFEQLMMWVESSKVPAQEWVAVYYDNPEEVPAEKLRCDTAVTVAEGYQLPEESEGVMMTEIAGGEYAVARVRVENDDFATPWHQFIESLMQSKEHQIRMAPCFEVYLNNGCQDGYWDVDIYIAVEPSVK